MANEIFMKVLIKYNLLKLNNIMKKMLWP